jgi:4-hydroxy-2-oxoheptanedioate aldolase
VLRDVAAQGKCPGILALTPADEERYAPMGARYFANVTTGLFTQALRQAATGGQQAISY